MDVVLLVAAKFCQSTKGQKHAKLRTTFPIFFAQLYTILAQLLDFLSATFWGDYDTTIHTTSTTTAAAFGYC